MQRPVSKTTILALALCACLASPLLLAATPIDQTRPLDPRGTHRDRQPQGPHPGARLGPQRGAHHRIARRRRREARRSMATATTSPCARSIPSTWARWRGDRTGPTDLHPAGAAARGPGHRIGVRRHRRRRRRAGRPRRRHRQRQRRRRGRAARMPTSTASAATCRSRSTAATSRSRPSAATSASAAG